MAVLSESQPKHKLFRKENKPKQKLEFTSLFKMKTKFKLKFASLFKRHKLKFTLSNLIFLLFALASKLPMINDDLLWLLFVLHLN